MKVLIVTNMYPTEKMRFYGIFVKEQADSLAELGVSVEVFFINGKESRFSYLTCIPDLGRKLRKTHYDVIHFHHTYCVYPFIIASIFCNKKTPRVLSFHEGEVHKTKEVKVGNIDFVKRLVFSKIIKRIAIKMVDIVIAVQEDLMKVLNFRGRYVVIPCGVDLNLFRPMAKERCRKELHLPLDRKIVFFPASPGNTNKGIDVLQQALGDLERKDLHLVTAGHITHEDMPIYMCAADVIVQLSDYEASPMVLKEAMAVNVPVVFSEVGDAKMIVRNTEGCFLCTRNHRDVALKLMDALSSNGNSEGRKRIREAGLALPDVAKKIVDVYKDLLPRNRIPEAMQVQGR